MVSQFDYLYEYLVIYRECGLKGAAEVLHVSTSTLSKHLSALESCLGFKLLERGRHVFEPTDMGVKVWDAAYPLLEIESKLQAIVLQGSPLLVYPMISNPEFYTMLCSIARSFAESHGNANVVIDQESTFNNPFAALEGGKIDVLAYDVYATPHFEGDPFRKQVSEQRFQAVVTVNNPLASRGSVTLSELSECTLSQLKGSAALLYYTWRAINRSFIELGLTPRFRDRRIYMPIEAAQVPIADDEALIVYANSDTTNVYGSKSGYKVLDIDDMTHPIEMACRADNKQAVDFILSV